MAPALLGVPLVVLPADADRNRGRNNVHDHDADVYDADAYDADVYEATAYTAADTLPEETLTRRTQLIAFLALWLALLPAAVAQGTADVSSLVREGNFYLVRGDCELAQYFFQEALKLETSNAEALIGKGKALSCQGALSLAVEEFQKAIEIDADNARAYVQLAQTYEDQYFSDPNRFPNRLSDALTTLEKAEQLAPDDPQVLNTKGVILYLIGDLEQARSALERAVAQATTTDSDLTQREQSTIQVNLGKTYRDIGELELARQAFRRAVVLDPTNASAHNNLGNIHYRLGDCDQAEYELAQAATLAPTSLSSVSQLAIALFECGQVEASIPRFEQALDLDGAVFTPPLYTYLARGYLQQGRYDEAVTRAQQGALLPPESAEAYYYLGQAYQQRGRSGDLDAARRAYQKSLEIDPNYAPAQQALASL